MISPLLGLPFSYTGTDIILCKTKVDFLTLCFLTGRKEPSSGKQRVGSTGELTVNNYFSFSKYTRVGVCPGEP